MPALGITRIAVVTGLDIVGIPVAMVCRPNSRSLSVSQGKGIDLLSAKASGLMEAVETFHAEHIDSSLRLGCLEDLRYQYDIGDVLCLPKPANTRFTPFTRILWIEADDLVSGRRKLVPYELVHMDYSLPMPSGSGCFVASSSGLASGNHLLEATIHGLCELIERDAAAVSRLNGLARSELTMLRIEDIDDPVCLDLLEKFRRADIAVGVWDLTSDTGVPVFLCRIVARAEIVGADHRPASGFGCHASKGIALCRALTEAAQSRLTFISGSRDDLWREDFDWFLSSDTIRTWRKVIDRSRGLRPWGSIPTRLFESLEDELDWLIDRLAAVGLPEVLRVDLTRPEFGIPVVRMIVPGLEPFGAATGYQIGVRAAAASRNAA